MKIIQITDLHIDHQEENPFNIDVRSNFINIMAAIKKANAEHLVITGDLCYRSGETEIYSWLYARLESAGIPYDIIPGNHDDTEMMARIFEREHLLTDGEMYFVRKLGKQSCIFLDSSKGSHSDNQLKWLERQLKNASGDLLLFMHHPAALSGATYMDNNYALQDMDQLQNILYKYASKILIYCGHYHVDRIVVTENMILHITPSCFFQIDSQAEEFKVDHHRIAYREIEIVAGSIRSEVQYLEGCRIN